MSEQIKSNNQIEEELLNCRNLNQIAKVMGISYYALSQMINKLGITQEEYLSNIGEMYVEVHGRKHFHPRTLVEGGRLPRELSAEFINALKIKEVGKRGRYLLEVIKADYDFELSAPTAITFDNVTYHTLHDFANRFGFTERELRFITDRKGVTEKFQNDLVKYFKSTGRLKFIAYSAGKIIGSQSMNLNILAVEMVKAGFIERPLNVPLETYLSAIVNSHLQGFSNVFKQGESIQLFGQVYPSIQEMLSKFKADLSTFIFVSTGTVNVPHSLTATSKYSEVFKEKPYYVNGTKLTYPVEILRYANIDLGKLDQLLKNGVSMQDIATEIATNTDLPAKQKEESSELRTQLTDAKSYFSSIGVPFVQALKVAKQLDLSLTELREVVEGFEIEIEGSKLKTYSDFNEILGITFERFVEIVKEVKDISDEDERCFAFIEKCV